MRFIGLSAFILLTIPVRGQQQRQQPGSGGSFYSLEKEAALGRVLADDFRRQVSVVEDEVLRAYLTKVVARLNQFAESPFPITVEIFEGTRANSETVGLPGGHLFVPLTLIAGAREEAELVLPVAHAMAHSVARHATRQAVQGQTSGVTPIPVIFGGGLQHGDSLVIPLALRKLREEQEAEAARLAVEWVAGFADGRLETGEFVSARDRARGMVPPTPANSAAPSLRKRGG